MFSEDIKIALNDSIADRIRFFEQEIQFYLQKEADPLLEDVAYQMSRGHFYLLKVEEVRIVFIRFFEDKIALLKKRAEGGFVLEHFICQECRQSPSPITRLLIEPDSTACLACEPSKFLNSNKGWA